MKGRIVISIPVDCVDEPDGIDAALSTLARAIGTVSSVSRIRQWLRERAEVHFEPDEAQPDSD